MDQQQQHILSRKKQEFEYQGLHQTYQQNVWIMAATAIPFEANHVEVAVAVEEVLLIPFALFFAPQTSPELTFMLMAPMSLW